MDGLSAPTESKFIIFNAILKLLSQNFLVIDKQYKCSGEFILWTHVTNPFFNEYDYFEFINSFLKKNKMNKKIKSAFTLI